MKSFATSIAIRAPAETIWRIITDASAYPKLDPMIARVDGRIGHREAVTVHANGRAFRLSVVEFTTNERMVWSGGSPLGLFTGKRTFSLSPKSGDEIEFAMREDFTGLMQLLFTRSMPDLQPSFDAFASNLKQQAETKV